MGLAAAPALTLEELHALQLRDAGWLVEAVVRVFPPFDTGAPAEVLFQGRKTYAERVRPLTGWCAADEPVWVEEGW